jgi:hypothetical protein
MGIVELYVIIISTLSLAFSLLVYFGIYPKRIRSLVISFVRFMRLHPQIIITIFLILILVNLFILGFKAGYFSGILTGVISGITGALTATLISFLIRLTTGKKATSTHTQLLAVIAARFHSISELKDGAKIVPSTYGPSLQWLQTALAAYGISFGPVYVPTNELFMALKVGVVDAVLITNHPLDIMKASIKSGEIRLLPWSRSAQEAVTRAFPTETRLAVLPANTYDGQQGDIQGYAPY